MKLKALVSPLLAVALATGATTVAVPQAAAAEVQVIHDVSPNKYLTQSHLNALVGFEASPWNLTREGADDAALTAVAYANYYDHALQDYQKFAIVKLYFEMPTDVWGLAELKFSEIKWQDCTNSLLLIGCTQWSNTKTRKRKVTGQTVYKLYSTLPLEMKKKIWASVSESELKQHSEDGDIHGGWFGDSPYVESQKYKNNGGQGTPDPSMQSGSSENSGIFIIAAVAAILGALAAAGGKLPPLPVLPSQ